MPSGGSSTSGTGKTQSHTRSNVDGLERKRKRHRPSKRRASRTARKKMRRQKRQCRPYAAPRCQIAWPMARKPSGMASQPCSTTFQQTKPKRYDATPTQRYTRAAPSSAHSEAGAGESFWSPSQSPAGSSDVAVETRCEPVGWIMCDMPQCSIAAAVSTIKRIGRLKNSTKLPGIASSPPNGATLVMPSGVMTAQTSSQTHPMQTVRSGGPADTQHEHQRGHTSSTSVSNHSAAARFTARIMLAPSQKSK
mmetsp:Transcript_23986/g.70780  ORF Transcript_23986/g.70780 Transcript_23986/m.70780 type:complete len:250 (+) Transcript_23986:187-936(+)